MATLFSSCKHGWVPVVGKPLELPVPDGLGCDDVYERAIGWRKIGA